MSDCFITRRAAVGGIDLPKLNTFDSMEYSIPDDSLVISDSWQNGDFTDRMSLYKNDVFINDFNTVNGVTTAPITGIDAGDKISIINKNFKFTDSDMKSYTLTVDDFIGFGDGHFNKVANGYANHLKVNGTAITMASSWSYSGGNLQNSDIGTLFANNPAGYTSYLQPLFNWATNNYGVTQESTSKDCYQYWDRVLSGTNIYDKCCTPVISNRRTIVLIVRGGNMTSSISIGNIKFWIDHTVNTSYSLSELINMNIIEPLIITMSGSSGPYYFSSLYNLLESTNTCSGNYPTAYIIFIIKPGHSIDKMQLYASRNTDTSYADGLGWNVFDFNLFKITYM